MSKELVETLLDIGYDADSTKIELPTYEEYLARAIGIVNAHITHLAHEQDMVTQDDTDGLANVLWDFALLEDNDKPDLGYLLYKQQLVFRLKDIINCARTHCWNTEISPTIGMLQVLSEFVFWREYRHKQPVNIKMMKESQHSCDYTNESIDQIKVQDFEQDADQFAFCMIIDRYRLAEL